MYAFPLMVGFCQKKNHFFGIGFFLPPNDFVFLTQSFFYRTETSRPFISGQVAHTMASEVISLLHGFLTHSTSETAKIWASSVRDVLCEALNYVPDLVRTLEAEGRISSDGPQTALKELDSEDDEKTGHEQEWIFKARSIMASLCALGGFGQSIHPGCTVLVKN